MRAEDDKVSERAFGPVSQSLERLSEIAGDPSVLIYDRLFEQHPEYRELFVFDTNGDVRGEMLSQAFDVLLRTDQGDKSADVLMRANRFAHDGYGVSEDAFNSFFEIIQQVTKDQLGDAWSPEMGEGWHTILDQLTGA